MNIQKIMAQEVTPVASTDIYYMSAMKLGANNIISVKLDPATIAALVEIGKALLINVGIKALSKWLGIDGSIDLKDLLRKILDEITSTVKLSINENEVRLAQDQINAVNVLLREYVNSPETSRFRLEESIVRSAVANETLARLLPLSSSGYVLGVLTRLAALQELALVSGTSGEQRNVGQYASDALPKMRGAFEQLLAMNDNRIGQIVIKVEHKRRFDFLRATHDGSADENIEREIPEPKFWVTVVTVSYWADGITRNFSDEENGSTSGDRLKAQLLPQANQARDSDLQRVRVDFMSQVGVPLLESIKNVEAVAAKFM